MLVRIMRCKGRTPDIGAQAVFSEAGGTIGRSSQCTLALPDADRHISRIQAEVSWSGTAFVLTDRGSGNPTVRNGEAVGMGQSVTLTDGDELHIGDYVLRVEMPPPRTATHDGDQAGQSTELAATSRNLALMADGADRDPQAPLADSPASAHWRNSPAADPPPAEMHADGNINAEGDIAFRSWESSDGGGSTAINPGRQREAPHRTVRAPALRSAINPPDTGAGSSPAMQAAHAVPAMPAVPAVPAVPLVLPVLPVPKTHDSPSLHERSATPSPDGRAASATGLLAALLAGAGLREAPRDPVSGRQFELDEHTMEHLGKLLRLLSQGVIDLLATRTLLKSEMHAAVTVIAAQGNNPLKFSPDASTALAFLLAAEPPRGFMAPETAVEDAISDLVTHQTGMLSGMRAALEDVLLRFEPQRLEARLAPKTLLGGVLPMNRKAKLWEQFEALYEGLSGEARDDFDALFGEAFVRAYGERIAALRQQRAASAVSDGGGPDYSDNRGSAGKIGER